MKKIIDSVLFVLVTIYGHSQIVLPLYETIPYNIPGIKTDEVVNTWKNDGRDIRFIRKISIPEIYVYLPKIKNTGKAVIICPGGGYSGLAIDHEGHDIAIKLNEYGIAGIVLKNRCPDTDIVTHKTLVPLHDAQRAIQLVRTNAAKWKIQSVGIMGSSAGGHLASTATTHYNEKIIDNPQGLNLRPDFAILNYPVISFADSITHKGSRDNLLKNENGLDEALVKAYSNELRVTSNTPPIFITHAENDDVVPVANSILFIAACLQNQVPVESYFYAKGGHGYGMNNPTAKRQWIEPCIKWILKR